MLFILMIHHNIGEWSSGRKNEFDPLNIDLSFVAFVRGQKVSTIPSNEITIDLNFLVYAFNDYSMNILEPITSLPLHHPELIDWNYPSPINEVLTF